MMLRKIFAVVCVAFTVVCVQYSAKADDQLSAIPSPADDAQLVDTLVCPQLNVLTENYLAQGMSERTEVCSLISWDSFEYYESLGEYPVTFYSWYEVDAPEEIQQVEVFRVKFKHLQLYAIKNFIDEHMLDEGKFGRLPGVAYDIWEDKLTAQEI